MKRLFALSFIPSFNYACKKCVAVILFAALLFSPIDILAGEWIVETSPTDYHPSRLKAEVGDKVTWVNKDMVVHEMAFNGNPSDTDKKNLYLYLPVGKKVSIILTRPGTYSYKCSWHGMFGSIEVSPGKK